MMDIVSRIAAQPALGMRIPESHQKAISDFIQAIGWDRDADTTAAVALGIVAMINNRRGVPLHLTLQHTKHVACNVAYEWENLR